VIIETNRTIRNGCKTRACCCWYTFRTGIARNLRRGTVHLVVNHFFFFAWGPHVNQSPLTPVLCVAASVCTKGQSKLVLLFYVGCSESNDPCSFPRPVTRVGVWGFRWNKFEVSVIYVKIFDSTTPAATLVEMVCDVRYKQRALI